MDIIEIAKKFSANPSACTAEEIALLARDFHDAHPQAHLLFPIGNAHPRGRWDGLRAEIKRAHFERQNFEALAKNPFATEAEIKAMPQPSDLANLSQAELGRLIFGG